MKHRALVSTFGRRTDARKALIRGLVSSLVEHGRITTTLAKAKELRRHAERAVTMAKKSTVHSRRVLLSRYPNQMVVEKLMSDLGPAFKTTPGGYTRILKVGRRPGDSAEMALIEWTNYQLPSKAQESEGKEASAKTEKKASVKKKAPAAKKSAAKKTAKKAKA